MTIPKGYIVNALTRQGIYTDIDSINNANRVVQTTADITKSTVEELSILLAGSSAAFFAASASKGGGKAKFNISMLRTKKL